jgi:hypothetical protein
VGVRATEGMDNRVYSFSEEREISLGLMAVFSFDGNPVRIPNTACLTGCSHKSPSAQTNHKEL